MYKSRLSQNTDKKSNKPKPTNNIKSSFLGKPSTGHRKTDHSKKRGVQESFKSKFMNTYDDFVIITFNLKNNGR